MFDNKFLSSSRKLKIGPRYFIFQSNRRTYVITILGVLCIVYWCLTKSLWIYSQISQNKQRIQRKRIYFPKYRMIKFTCTKDLFRIIYEKNNCWYQKYIAFTLFHWNIDINKISVWFVIYSYLWGRSRKQNKSVDQWY